MNKKIFITGGLGFAGKNFYNKIKYSWDNIIILDKKTYAADYKFFKKNKLKNHKLIIADVCDKNSYEKFIDKNTIVVHFAAESHVDNSFKSSIVFTKSNTLGSHVLLEVCRNKKPKRIIFISTDEVYGEAKNLAHNEQSLLEPTNPYSASKAGADLLAQTYIKSFKMPIVIIRANNLYGPRQHSEKIIPAIIRAISKKTKVLLHGKGQTSRNFLHIDDLTEAINLLIKKSKDGEIYNIAGQRKFKIINLVKKISKISNLDYKKYFNYTKDRPFNDKLYKISSKKIQKLGWKEKKVFEKEIKKLLVEKSYI